MSESDIKGKIGEDAVNELANNTYLKYWCYPSPKDENGDRKEICDLLIIFQKTVLIVSVKNYNFSGNYKRYFRSTINKAVSQVQGAERRLFNFGTKTIKHPTKGNFEFDPSKYKSIHRVVVNLNTLPLFY